ncbi:leucine-rich melanocyte differentiation-associated protein [Tachysurus ichikawai]
MPSLTTLWINKNKISNLPIIVEEIRCKFPNIKQYVISQIPSLEVLDDTEVQEKDRAQARKSYWMQKSRDDSKRRKQLHH